MFTFHVSRQLQVLLPFLWRLQIPSGPKFHIRSATGAELRWGRMTSPPGKIGPSSWERKRRRWRSCAENLPGDAEGNRHFLFVFPEENLISTEVRTFFETLKTQNNFFKKKHELQ